MSKPLVIHILWSLGRAGAERMVFDLARLLPERGYEVMVVAVEDGPMHQEFENAGVRVLVAPQGLSRIGLVDFFSGVIRREHPAVWHTHLGADVWAGLSARRVEMHPWMATLHSLEEHLSWFKRLLRHILLFRADHVVCISHVVQQMAKQRYGIADNRSSVIRLGVDEKYFSTSSSDLKRKELRVLCVGRLVASKNQETLIRGLARLDHPWHLTLLGDGPEEARLTALVQQLGVNSRVTFVGSVADPAPFFQAADLFCFPSVSEGQGLVLLEAASTGVPIITSDLPVYREAFDESSLCLVSSFRDPEAWTRALEQAIQFSDETKAKAERAKMIAHQTFSLSRMADEYAALYDRLRAV